MKENDKNKLPEPEVINLSIPAKNKYIVSARLNIAWVGKIMELSVDEIDDLKIVIAEACINAIQHAYHNNSAEKNKIEICYSVYPDKLRLKINDKGQGFDTKAVDDFLSKTSPKEKKPEGIGLGLFLIKTLMDEVKYKSDNNGTEVSMVKKIKH